MSVLEVFQWIQGTRLSAALRGSALVYPIVMTGHLTGMGLFGGMIAITLASRHPQRVDRLAVLSAAAGRTE